MWRLSGIRRGFRLGHRALDRMYRCGSDRRNRKRECTLESTLQMQMWSGLLSALAWNLPRLTPTRCLPASRGADESAYSWDQSRELPRYNMNSYRRRECDLNTSELCGQAYNPVVRLNPPAPNYLIRVIQRRSFNFIHSFPSCLGRVTLTTDDFRVQSLGEEEP